MMTKGGPSKIVNFMTPRVAVLFTAHRLPLYDTILRWPLRPVGLFFLFDVYNHVSFDDGESSVLEWRIMIFSKGRLQQNNENIWTNFKNLLQNHWTNFNQTLHKSLLSGRGFKFVQMKGELFHGLMITR